MLRDTLETEPEDLIEPLNGKLEVFTVRICSLE